MENPNRISAAPSDPKLNGPDRKPGRKARVPLSCGPCRYRKLKCNRQQPCQNCIVRKEPGACVFAKSENTTAPTISHMHVENMQHQIDRLESLVTSFMSQKNRNEKFTPPSDSIDTKDGSPATGSTQISPAATGDIPDMEETRSGQGMIKVDEEHSIFVGPSHWSDVLHELNALKTSWSQVQEEQYELDLSASVTSSTADGPSFLCGIVSPIGTAELLASLPAKPVADKLLAIFFDEEDSLVPSIHILHKPTFLKQYEEHWNSPFDTKLMWLGLLFSILSLAMASQSRPTEEPPECEGVSKSLSDLYRLRTAQCLMMADITKCLPYTVETLMYNVLAEQVGNRDGSAGVWVMFGSIIRVAIQMGYHRDPSQYPNIPVFQGEMRRRVWCALVTMDAVSSFMVGLPSITRTVDHDTAEPKNVHDWELYDGMVKLPTSRPLSDITPISYSTAKARLLRPLGEVVDFVNSLQCDSYDRALEIDEKLSSAHLEMPSHLRLRSVEQTAGYSLNTINRMVQIEFLFHQGVCVLHRRFLVRGRLDKRFARSREQCIRSAMVLLNHQRVLYEVAKMTGSSTALYWFQVSSISQAFILPAVILCLDLRHRKNRAAGDEQSNSWNGDTREETMLDALKTAKLIWKGSQDISLETWKVYRVLSQFLENLDASEKDDPLPTIPEPTSDIIEQESTAESDVLAFDRSLNMSVNEMDIDWSAWDSFVEGSSFDDAYGAMHFDEHSTFNAKAGEPFFAE